MGSDKELVRLEQYIERLLTGYAALKEEKLAVEKQLATVLEDKATLQGENEQMKNELDSLDSERGVMHDRVSSLIGQIEAWESEIETDTAEDSAENSSEEEVLEDSEESAEKEGQDDKGAKSQKNLFSA